MQVIFRPFLPVLVVPGDSTQDQRRWTEEAALEGVQ
jgi:hypothetical protein